MISNVNDDFIIFFFNVLVISIVLGYNIIVVGIIVILLNGLYNML